MKGVLILKHIKVENANAIAGMTWGFPAVANFLGFVHALQRQFAAKSGLPALKLLGCGIVCHDHQPQAHKTHEFGEHLFALTRNPVDKTGKSSSFVEEGRMHMDVSLVIPFDGRIRGQEGLATTASSLQALVLLQRLAGGTILDIAKVELQLLNETVEANQNKVRRIMRSLLPGFALVSRQPLLAQHQRKRQEQSGPLAAYGCDSTDLQAWLEFASITHSAEPADEDGKVQWQTRGNPYGGWVKPIAVGYKAISPLYQPGEVANVRDNQTPVQMVEMLYSLGEWLSPHRIKTIEQLFWYYQHDDDHGVYQCKNDYMPADDSAALSTESNATA